MGEKVSKSHQEYHRNSIKQQGFVEKYSFKRGVTKKRYFTLKDTTLSYSANKDEPPLHEVKIDHTFKILSEDIENKELSIECINQRGEPSLWKLIFSTGPNAEQWLKKLKMAVRPLWDDPKSKKCVVCDKDFKVFRRQHHCRKCGHVMCSSHTKIINHLQELGYEHKVKVCSNCITLIEPSNLIQRARSFSMHSSEKPDFSDRLTKAYQSRSVLDY